MTAEALGQPSEILEEWLRTQPHNWVDALWDEELLTKSGSVTCHCQGAILRDHALDKMGRPTGRDEVADGYAQPFLSEAYALDIQTVRKAIKANDNLDAEDIDALNETVTDDDLLSALRSLAPKYIGRAIAVYKKVGR